jgi:hypothetical protein
MANFAINERAIQGQDCQLTLETVTLDLTLVNWDNWDFSERWVKSEFIVAQSTVTRFTTPRKESPVFRLRGKRGVGETYVNLRQMLQDENVVDFVCTDLPSHEDLVAEYGPAKVNMVGSSQPNEFGTYELELSYGLVQSGYTPVGGGS